MSLAEYCAAVERRVRAATPGPWERTIDGRHVHVRSLVPSRRDPAWRDWVCVVMGQPDVDVERHNGELLASAPSDLTRLLQIVRTLSGALAETSAQIMNPLSMTDARRMLADAERRCDDALKAAERQSGWRGGSMSKQDERLRAEAEARSASYEWSAAHPTKRQVDEIFCAGATWGAHSRDSEVAALADALKLAVDYLEPRLATKHGSHGLTVVLPRLREALAAHRERGEK